MSLEDKNFGKVLSGQVHTTHEVRRCVSCDGIGYRNEKGWIDGTYFDPNMVACDKCKGDGRLLEISKKISTYSANFSVTVPYIEYVDKLDPFLNNKKEVYYRFSLYDKELESKYPELAALSDQYNDLVEKYKLIELLKKEEGK